MSQPPLYYFAYGSNLNRADMGKRCPGAKPLTTAALAGWRLTFRGVADIEPEAGETVQGALWRLDRADLRSLDRYEAAPHRYERRALAGDTESGPLEAIAYVMTSDDYLGLPSPWYFERVARGYDDWGLPRAALTSALRATREELASQGVSRFRPDGRKRLRGLAD
jgi:gamma-glutamylcyclotransferase (GGCT)/AIG2-like uncharacterized protein YtfP